MDALSTIAVLYALSRRGPRPTTHAPLAPSRNVRTFPIAGRTLPTSGILSFGYQRTSTHRHNGIDIPAPSGTPVLASADGEVTIVTYAWRPGFTGYGRVVVIRHDVGALVWTLSAHLQEGIVTPGQPVKAGDVIGYVGRTQYLKDDHTDSKPRKMGSHLHFEVSPRAYPQPSTARRLDPVAWLRAEPMGAV